MANEKTAVLVICSVLALAIITGFVSFTGMAVYNIPLAFDMEKSYSNSDVFDADLIINAKEVSDTETMVVYLDNNPVGIIPLKNYLDANSINYKEEEHILILKEKFNINLANHIDLNNLKTGNHLIRARFSEIDVAVDAKLIIE